MPCTCSWLCTYQTLEKGSPQDFLRKSAQFLPGTLCKMDWTWISPFSADWTRQSLPLSRLVSRRCRYALAWPNLPLLSTLNALPLLGFLSFSRTLFYVISTPKGRFRPFVQVHSMTYTHIYIYIYIYIHIYTHIYTYDIYIHNIHILYIIWIEDKSDFGLQEVKHPGRMELSPFTVAFLSGRRHALFPGVYWQHEAEQMVLL